jgi:DUF4097 and DUF4098 domain-containing protein YvlB
MKFCTARGRLTCNDLEAETKAAFVRNSVEAVESEIVESTKTPTTRANRNP